ncbi:DNA-directed RNA polymerase I subunit RPA34 [Bufo bufo]|uniref:DNA-directed RNA polymerase I subunit RPA34 n=1 Tax=Bufo bufo TaxID=8384 RepID=UPI001ABDC042|nr:DNA-directed RNA polymerase I subunit RPA34 [Bufo bufo]
MEGGRRCRFQCPLGFEAVAGGDGSVTGDAELWLIQAPADVSPESFDSHRLPLSGYKMQRVRDGGVKKYYHVASSSRAALPLRAFLHSSADRLEAAAPFCGVITLAEAHGDHPGVRSVPDRPPLSLPQGLKPRYRPFGAVAPGTGESGDTQVSGGISRKKKKSRKRRAEEADP